MSAEPGPPFTLGGKRYTTLLKLLESPKFVVTERTAAAEVVVVVVTEVLVVHDPGFRGLRARGIIDIWKLKRVDADVICGKIAVEACKRLRELGPGVAWNTNVLDDIPVISPMCM